MLQAENSNIVRIKSSLYIIFLVDLIKSPNPYTIEEVNSIKVSGEAIK